MRNRVEKLRVWLLGSAVFLIVVIAAFIGSAHYLRHRFLANLPARLGINIVRETNGYTYCQSVQGRTAYCIHAAKAVEHTDGKIALHDVSVVLYGKKGDRSDRIYGDEFEYDQNAGVVRAQGVVHIDLQAAATPGQRSSGKVMHVTTSGLVYLEKLGVAATNEYIEFQSGDITGHATGGDYASDSGMLVLHSAVSMNGAAGGRPFGLTAATAQFDDREQQAFLTRATYRSDDRTAIADQATLYRRVDGTLSRIAAQGNVKVEAKGATVLSEKADVALTATSQPKTALLTGAVKYSSDEPLRQVRGQSDEATIDFDSQAKPQPQHAVFTGGVHMTERTRATDAAKEPWSMRDLTAAKLETELVPAGPGKSELRDADATGNPKINMANHGSAAKSGDETTDLSADDLKAHFVAAADVKQPSQLDTIMGRGHTVLRQMSVDGVEQTSTGDTLDAKFRPRAASVTPRPTSAGASTGQNIGDTVLSAVQQGHVTMMRSEPAKSQGTANSPTKAIGQAQGNDVERARAERAVYDGNLDTMTLTGGAQVMDAGSVLWANQVTLDHATGDSHAMGAVKMNYVQDASSQAAGSRTGAAQGRAATPGNGSQQGDPTHVLADRADLEHETGIATFYGKPARMWQDGNQVLAPVIEFSRTQKRLIARGEAGTGWSTATQAGQVHTVLAGAANDAPAGGPGSSGQSSTKAGAAACNASPQAKPVALKSGAAARGTDVRTSNVVKVASGGLIYSDIQRQADFTGGFRAETSDGTIRASEGVVYLAPRVTSPAGSDGSNANSGNEPTGPSLAGDLDHIVATGHVDLDKPGLKATGQRLVYTASDRTVLLTGDKDAPPKAIDAQGTTTGAVLRFRSSCDGAGGGSVEVLGGPGQQVQTDARIVNDGKKEKGKR
jgi:lipopolysaccharide export system protein LptA